MYRGDLSHVGLLTQCCWVAVLCKNEGCSNNCALGYVTTSVHHSTQQPAPAGLADMLNILVRRQLNVAYRLIQSEIYAFKGVLRRAPR